MPDWQPIESAPRDGTRILVWGKIFPEHAVACWRPKGVLMEGWESHPYSECDIVSPTHWMPLPDPPHLDTVQQEGHK
jgi:hypothetical protein